jgi:NO-binding membrane sensor protein with MHYT domain
MIQFLIARLREPSTYAGLAAVLTAAGITYSPDLLDAAVTVAAALAGLAAVLVPESKAGASKAA